MRTLARVLRRHSLAGAIDDRFDAGRVVDLARLISFSSSNGRPQATNLAASPRKRCNVGTR